MAEHTFVVTACAAKPSAMLDCTTIFNYPAPAKLNLFLHIVGLRAGGYHELQTLFQLLDYHDELSIRLRLDQELNLRCNLPISEGDNLVMKAAQLIQKHAPSLIGADLHLHKRIPLGAGLGGGSSDAATTLLALNDLWDCQLGRDDLLRYARQLGADVPLFVAGHSAWAEGVGDLLEAVDLPDRWYVVFTPPLQIATADVYQQPDLKRDCQKITLADYQAGCSVNVFEAVVTQHYPVIAQGINWLADYTEARLTGSGSAFFGCCKSEQQAHDLLQQCPFNLSGFVAKGINQSPLWRDGLLKKRQ